MYQFKWKVFLYSINSLFHFIKTWYLFAQLNDFKYSKWLNSSIWLIDQTLTDTITLGQSGSESNSSEGVLHIS